MSLFELLILAIGLSMDAFAVSVCKGLSVPKTRLSHSLICGAYAGGTVPEPDHLSGPLDRFRAAGRHRNQHDSGVPGGRGMYGRILCSGGYAAPGCGHQH